MKRMNIKNLILGGLLLAIPVLSFAGQGGSGVGGGVVFSSVINWCDDASIMVSEAREEALYRLHNSNDKIGSLRIFYQGLVDAAASSEEVEANVASSLTYRAITRGVRLSQLLGVPAIINGTPVSQGLAGEKQMQGLLSFMDWYTLNIQDVANAVDRNYYIPYTHDQNVNFSSKKLEEKLVDIALMNLRGLDERFVALKTEGDSYYTKVPVEQFMKSLSFLSSEVANDLDETLFSNALSCQSKRLKKLSRQIQSYLDGRNGGSEDALKLNKFVLDLRSIMKQIEIGTCGR